MQPSPGGWPGLDHAVQQPLKIAFERGDRRAQLVRDIANQVAAPALGCLERTGHVELRDAEHTATVVDGRTLQRIDADDHGVTIYASAALPFHVHSEVTFAEGGAIKLAATPDQVDGATMHVPMASLAQAQDLRAMLLAGASPGMHVASREPFSRAVGFWPRAWLFLAIAGACELIAAALLFVKRR